MARITRSDLESVIGVINRHLEMGGEAYRLHLDYMIGSGVRAEQIKPSGELLRQIGPRLGMADMDRWLDGFYSHLTADQGIQPQVERAMIEALDSPGQLLADKLRMTGYNDWGEIVTEALAEPGGDGLVQGAETRADSAATRYALVGTYLMWRVLGHGHTAAMTKAHKAERGVRRVLGYTYP